MAYPTTTGDTPPPIRYITADTTIAAADWQGAPELVVVLTVAGSPRVLTIPVPSSLPAGSRLTITSAVGSGSLEIRGASVTGNASPYSFGDFAWSALPLMAPGTGSDWVYA